MIEWLKDKLSVPARFGDEEFIVGKCRQKLTIFNGIRVNSKFGKGTIYNVLVNQQERLIQVWVNMDSGGARCFRPRHLHPVKSPIRGLQE